MSGKQTNQRRIDLLRQIGETIFGSDWQTALGQALNWHPPNVTAAMHGRRPIPERVWNALPAFIGNEAAAMVERSRKLHELADDVKNEPVELRRGGQS